MSEHGEFDEWERLEGMDPLDRVEKAERERDELLVASLAEKERTRHWRECAGIYKRQRDEALDLLARLPRLGPLALVEHVQAVLAGELADERGEET